MTACAARRDALEDFARVLREGKRVSEVAKALGIDVRASIGHWKVLDRHPHEILRDVSEVVILVQLRKDTATVPGRQF